MAGIWQAFEHHGLTGAGQASLLGGFQLIHGYGDCPPPGAICSVAGLDDGILIVAELGATGRVHLPYSDVLGLEAGGRGLITRDAGLIGGGFGLAGLAKGVVFAAVVNRITSRTTNDSYLRISATHTEMLFSHWRLPPSAVRAGLGRAFTGQLAATRRPPPTDRKPVPSAPQPPAASAIDELERLTKLHAAGTLTDVEFQMARDIQVRRLKDGG